MAYNPGFKSLERTYFQGEYVYEYGGWVPIYPVFQTTMNSTPTPTPTPTRTPTATHTPTPSITPNFVCPERVEISNHSIFPELDGFYDRVYSYPQGSYNYGYIDLVGLNYVFSAGPYLGNNYPVFVNTNTISPYSAST
jgi:hypothetical protein